MINYVKVEISTHGCAVVAQLVEHLIGNYSAGTSPLNVEISTFRGLFISKRERNEVL